MSTGWNEFELGAVRAIQRRFSGQATNVAARVLRRVITDEAIVIISTLLLLGTPLSHSGFVLTSMTLSECINGAIKFLTQRPRPFWFSSGNVRNPAHAFEADYSFPSSHAQVTASLVVAALMEYRLAVGTQLVLIFSVLVMGLARILLGVHFPTDVVVGWLIGSAVPLLLQHIDIVEWYTLLPSHAHRVVVAFLWPVFSYGLLLLIRSRVAGPSTEQIDNWQKCASPLEQKKLCLRTLDRYDFQIASFTGSLFAYSVLLVMPYQRFFFENDEARSLSWTDARLSGPLPPLSEIMSPYTFRLALGLIIQMAVLFPIAFCLPIGQADGQPRRRRRAFKWFAMMLTSVWVMLGTPLFSEYALGITFPIAPVSIPLSEKPHGDHLFSCHLEMPSLHIDHDLERRMHTVTSLSELQAHIRKASSKGELVRVVGGGHSQMLTEYLSRRADGITPPRQRVVRYLSLDHEAFSGYHLHPIKGNSTRRRVTVGAGMYAGQSPERGVPWDASLTGRLWQDGLALPNVPGVLFQTVAGLFLSPSDGGSSAYSISDALVEMRYVDARGNIQCVSREDTSDDGALRWAAFGGSSMGLMGVAIDFTLEVEPAYCIRRVFDFKTTDYLHDAGPRHLWHKARANEIIQYLDASDYTRMFVLARHKHKSAQWTRREQNSTSLSADVLYMDRDATRVAPNCTGDKALDGPTSDAVHAFIEDHSMPRFQQAMLVLMGNMVMQKACWRPNHTSPTLGSSFWASLKQTDLWKRAFVEAHRNPAMSGVRVIILERCLRAVAEANWAEIIKYGPTDELWGTCMGVSITPPHFMIGSHPTAYTAPWHVQLAVDATVDPRLAHVHFAELVFRMGMPWQTPNGTVVNLDEETVLSTLSEFLVNAADGTTDNRRSAWPTGASIIEVYRGRATPFLLNPNGYHPHHPALYKYNDNPLPRTRGTSLRVNVFAVAGMGSDVYEKAFARIWRAFLEAGIPFAVHLSKHAPLLQKDKAVLSGVRRVMGMARLTAMRQIVYAEDPLGTFRSPYLEHLLFS